MFAAAILAGVIFFVVKHWSSSLRDNFLRSFISAVLALVIGIPIGVQVSRWQQSRTEFEQKNRVLSFTREELLFNHQLIEGRHVIQEGNPVRVVSLPPLKADLWHAFVNSGDTKSINNPKLLWPISAAYYFINADMSLETRYFDVVTNPGLTAVPSPPPPGWKQPSERLLDNLLVIDNVALSAVAAAIDAINKEVPGEPGAALQQRACARPSDEGEWQEAETSV
jgi:hypothetical protein